jgi:hypothetical protein
LQILEPLQCLRPIWKQIQSGGWIFDDGNGAAVNVIVDPVDGDFKDARDLGHRQGTSDVAWMRLTALLKEPLF